MARRQLSSFRWNGTEWATVSTASDLENFSKSSTENLPHPTQTLGEPLRLATLNILADCFPWFVEMAVRSTERYEWLCPGIISLNPTILTLNEVTPTALQRLQQCSFIRENYFLTESVDEEESDNTAQVKRCRNEVLSPHGSIILSKLPLLEVFAISVSDRKREAIVGKVQLGNTVDSCAYFCTVHTTPHKALKNTQLRAQQIRDIVNVLQPLGLPFVIMGDLNLYYPFEDAISIDNQLIDAWAQTHFSSIYPFNDANEGYTFDALKNTMIPYYTPGNTRQMRLDRILFSSGFRAFAIAPCAMWANEPIKSGTYLFPSDHFGLYIDLVINPPDDERSTMPLGELDASVEQVLQRNAQQNTDQRPYRLGFVRTAVALTSHTAWLTGVALGLK